MAASDMNIPTLNMFELMCAGEINITPCACTRLIMTSMYLCKYVRKRNVHVFDVDEIKYKRYFVSCMLYLYLSSSQLARGPLNHDKINPV